MPRRRVASWLVRVDVKSSIGAPETSVTQRDTFESVELARGGC